MKERQMRYSILALALCAPLAACTQPAKPVDTAEAAKAVKAAEAEMLAAFKAKDAAKIASLYTPDAEVMVPFEPVVRGSDVAKSTAGDLKDPAFSIDFANTRTEVSNGGDMAFTHGTFTATYTNPATKQPGTMKGSYVTVFRKQADGSWKAVQDISTPGPG
jgi:uncharacterized protein (TIGR02246 family)